MSQNETVESPEAPIRHGALKSVWSISELREGLGNWSDDYTVEITLTRQEPTVWMKFVKGEDGCQ